MESPQVFRVYAPCSEVTDAENTNLAGEFKEPFCMSGVLQHVSKYMQLEIYVKIITHNSEPSVHHLPLSRLCSQGKHGTQVSLRETRR